MLVKEIVWSILDLARAATSDDSFLTEELVLFLCKKYRAFLIKKEQEKKNAAESISEFEYQEICIDLEPQATISNACAGGYHLVSTVAIPKLMEGTTPKIYPTDFYNGINICFVNKDRMKYIGTNKYLQNIIYVSIGPDFRLYVNSSNPQYKHLRHIRMTAVFEDPEEAAKLSCEGSSESGGMCDIMESEFPIREYLVPMLIELVVKEITGATLKKSDEQNNAKDDIAEENRRA